MPYFKSPPELECYVESGMSFCSERSTTCLNPATRSGEYQWSPSMPSGVDTLGSRLNTDHLSSFNGNMIRAMLPPRKKKNAVSLYRSCLCYFPCQLDVSSRQSLEKGGRRVIEESTVQCCITSSVDKTSDVRTQAFFV